MLALEQPAFVRLAELMHKADSDSVSFAAVKFVLEYCGYKAQLNPEDSRHVSLTIAFDRPPQSSTALPEPRTLSADSHTLPEDDTLEIG